MAENLILEGVLKPLDYFQLGWLGFFTLCLANLILQLEKRGVLSKPQATRTEPISALFSKHFAADTTPDGIQNAMFTYATQRVGEFFEKIISESTSQGQFSSLLSQVISKFTAEAYLHFLLGREAFSVLQEIVELCERKVLLTLDDFDTVFDAFRKRATDDADRRNRARIEVDWLRSLLILVNDIKTRKISVHHCFRTIDFCLTIPQDRFVEIEHSDRDGYRYHQATANILWTGIELCELLILRLQKMTDYTCKKTTTKERFEEILEEKWPELPTEISFSFNGFPIRISLFNYILRHTFWRPRDVLLYFGSLLAAALNIRDKGEKIDSEVVRRIISETTRRIIGTEFLREYETAIYSLEHVIKAFTSSPQAMTYEDLHTIIGKISFGVTAEDEEKVDMDRKIELLYEIGFLGVQFDSKLRETLNLGSECFYFNEGRTPLKAIKQSNYKSGKFVVHPIFAEHLLLDYSKNSFLLNFSWEYISRTHSIIVASAKGW
ncbi:MAG: hypothetical protein WDM80_03270 [Limisphaerales bacterium]